MSETFSAPFRARALSIDPSWIDYNGHLNQAYYALLFDRALDEVLEPAGLGPDYIRDRKLSYMTVESHLCYVREVFKDDPVRVSALVLDVDDKRLHMFTELRHASDGWLSCTAEWMTVHVDMAARRAVPWPTDVRARLEAMKTASASVGRPERAGRSIGIARKMGRPA
jgi:acyl-CoA thioester hydrolase